MTLGRVVDIGDKLEFCRIVDDISTVFYGEIVQLNLDTETVDFKTKDGKVYQNVSDRYIRGLYYIDWNTIKKRMA